jgi:hypothetical protein
MIRRGRRGRGIPLRLLDCLRLVSALALAAAGGRWAECVCGRFVVAAGVTGLGSDVELWKKAGEAALMASAIKASQQAGRGALRVRAGRRGAAEGAGSEGVESV